ncbi:hypothetical protein BV210_02390 [Halorientalis sp. IM1011]|uniref:hypothetical protein n=1 Tax=Halorientalis sp. IM1011 TaxID=1932360 RepID=UPI00097CC431|nr:hypothetical protein [Halorientalis sp. IM1011]AQL41633.1 hypothetical protein BV210_02390 [Halorientalis sp. IM1011]
MSDDIPADGDRKETEYNRRKVVKSIGGATVALSVFTSPASAGRDRDKKRRTAGSDDDIQEVLRDLDKAEEEGRFDEEWKSLSEETREEVIDQFETEIDIREAPEGANAADLEGYAFAEVYRTAPEIGRIWTYEQEIEWDYDDDADEITDIEKYARGTTKNTYAIYEGKEVLDENGGVGEYDYRYHTQGTFKICITRWGCLDQKNPYIDMTVDADGGSEIDKGA